MAQLTNYIIGILIACILALSLAFYFKNSSYDKLTAEYNTLVAQAKVNEIQISGLESAIKKQTDANRELEAKENQHKLEIAKTITKIDTQYIERIKLVKDLNVSEECAALQRIIDEDINSTIANP